jgi:hypothetical protein
MFLSQDNLYNPLSLKEEYLQLSFPNSDPKYIIKIYLSKNKGAIIFKIEEINNVTHYFYEKFDPRDFSKKYKGIISQENILAAFNDIKKIIKEKEIKIEEGKKKIYLIFLQKNENEKADVIFILRKKYICQNKINKIYIEKINSNLKILKSIEIKMNNLDKTLEDHNIIINNVKNKITNINNKIQNIYNEINNINNALKNSFKPKEKEFIKDNTNVSNKKITINKNPKIRQSVFLLVFLNIFFFILIYNLFNCFSSVKEDFDITTEQREKFYDKFPIIETIFGEYSDNFKSEITKHNGNKTSIIEYNSLEINDIIKNLDLRTIFLDTNLNLINNQEVLKSIQSEIIEIKNNSIREVNLILKYSKENSLNNFSNNLQSNKENLIYIQNKKGKIIYIFSSNIIKLIEDIMNKKLEKVRNNIIYIFKEKENCEENISKENIFKETIDIIFSFINSYDNSYIENVYDLKIYEVNYTICI